MENFKTTSTIEEIAEKVAMGPFGSSIKVETFVSEGVPIISGQHLNRAKVDDSPGFNFISLEHAGRLANANVTRGDIVFTHAGNIGQVAYIPKDSSFDRYVISQRQFYMRCDRKRVIPEYLVWYFKSPEGQHQLLANTSQVGVPSIAQPVTYLRTLAISLPPLSEQRAIAHILGTLDDRIELNRRMNETLEEMARTLFKSWFVDFDPVRAKAAIRTPPVGERDWTVERARAYLDRMDDRLVDHFPDRLVDSELGKIPEGWQVGRFSDIVSRDRDKVNPASFPKTVFSHFSIPAFDEGQNPKRELGESIKSTKSRVVQDDVLLSKLNPEIKRVWLPNVAPDERAICSTEFLVLQAKPPFQCNYVYCLSLSPFFRRQLESIVTGTSKSHQRAPADAILSLETVIPHRRASEAFETSASKLLQRSMNLRRESRYLAEQRDALLPQLVCGETSVPSDRG
ncbi:MAG: restriction endonuclease subunit S [Gemmatimonadota bacterium]|nr:restriction endonuclease subunit S [Gemmatimonadota bacterium]